MKKRKLADVEVKEVFEKLGLPNNQENQNFEVWEVTPLKKGTKIFFESC